MAVKLRLRRMGRKKKPFYRIVAADSRSPRDGRFIEEIGYYNPLTDPMTIEVKQDRALYWLGQGAIPSDTVKNLFTRKGLNMRFDLMRRGVDEAKIEAEMQQWAANQADKQQKLELQKEAELKKAAAAKKAEEEAANKAEEEAAKAAEEEARKAEEAAAAEAEAKAEAETADAEEADTAAEDSGEEAEASAKE